MSGTLTIKSIAASLEALSEDGRDLGLVETANGKEERVYNQREAMVATDTHSAQLNEICKTLNIDPKSSGKWRIKLSDVQAVRIHLGHAVFRRNENQQLAIWTTATLKGGAGKTTDTATIAVGIATECMTQYRVGVIDLDPQGTLTALIKPNLTTDDFTVGDLLIAARAAEEGDEENILPFGADESFDQTCRDSFLPTNHANLRILPAGDNDREYETVVEGRKIKADREGRTYSAFKDLESIIDAVKDEFDIIFIDTPPQFNTASMSGQFVANGLIIPLRPSENDRDASSKYIKYLAKTDEMLTELGQRKKEDISILISGVSRSSRHQTLSVAEIRGVIGQWCYNEDFIHSDAVSNCAKYFMTVFDVSPSGFVGKGSIQSIKKAQAHFKGIVFEVESKIKRTWGL